MQNECSRVQLCYKEDILSLLPEAKRKLKIPRVAAQVMRTGTGRFDTLDDRTLVHILNGMPLSKRLLIATSVCKSWRVLREVRFALAAKTITAFASAIRTINAADSQYHLGGLTSEGLTLPLIYSQERALWASIDVPGDSIFAKGQCLLRCAPFVRWDPDALWRPSHCAHHDAQPLATTGSSSGFRMPRLSRTSSWTQRHATPGT